MDLTDGHFLELLMEPKTAVRTGRLECGKPHRGFTLVRDFCGVVLEVVRGVLHLAPGDKVWGAIPYHALVTLS